MLRINYIPDFKAGQPFVVITGERDSFLNAAQYFRGRESAHLTDSGLSAQLTLGALSENALHLNSSECEEIAQHFEQVATVGIPCHAYMDIEALPEAEIIISLGEYEF